MSVFEAKETRLIASLKQLSAYENLEDVVDMEQVLRYFVVHNFVVNDDSYTGSMIHNYYLYEEDGQLSMIPWDYNLAFGTFQGSNATSSVNDSIDDVLSDRPMQAWIFSDEAYTEQYYALYAEMLSEVDIQAIIDNAYALIAPYVEKDPTAFCSYEEFENGVTALKQFCELRMESVRLQLDGSDETVDASDLTISDMGTMGGGMGGGFGGGRDSFDSENGISSSIPQNPNASSQENNRGEISQSGNNQWQNPWGSGEMPNMNDFDMSNIPQGGMQFPSGSQNSGAQSGNLGSANTGFTMTGNGVLFVISIIVLTAGLVFALFFKRR